MTTGTCWPPLSTVSSSMPPATSYLSRVCLLDRPCSSGVNESIVKAATVFGPPVASDASGAEAQASTSASSGQQDDEMASSWFVPHLNEAVLKVAVEPLVPTDLPKLLARLRGDRQGL